MAFLFTIPLFLGIAICVVPLQLGARTLAFPRAAAASFWGWLVASGVLIASYIMNGGPGGGDAKGVDLFLLSFAALVAVADARPRSASVPPCSRCGRPA